MVLPTRLKFASKNEKSLSNLLGVTSRSSRESLNCPLRTVLYIISQSVSMLQPWMFCIPASCSSYKSCVANVPGWFTAAAIELIIELQKLNCCSVFQPDFSFLFELQKLCDGVPGRHRTYNRSTEVEPLQLVRDAEAVRSPAGCSTKVHGH
jgi:hypothetical protein